MQTYFLWKTIQAFASVTEADALKPYKRFLNTLSGRDADSVPERWRTCVNHVDSGLPWILSRFFVEKAFSEEAKRFGDEIVSDIKEQFIGKIGRTEWMEDGVKEKAIEKVRRIVQKIGYPTESPDIMDPGVLKDWYRAVHVGKGTFFDNYLSMTRLQVAQEWCVPPSPSPSPSRLQPATARLTFLSFRLQVLPRQTRRPRRLGHVRPHRQRILQPAWQRDRLPRRHHAVPRLLLFPPQLHLVWGVWQRRGARAESCV